MLGNPQLGQADLTKPPPFVLYPNGQHAQLQVCPHCRGYFLLMCPCGGWAKTGNTTGVPLNADGIPAIPDGVK